MAQAELENQEAEQQGNQLESGTYEIIRNRLNGHAKDLRGRLDKLNGARKEVFGAIETTLLGTERITTEHNCVPRDMVSVGDYFIFGYNVHLGLKSETDLADVFSVYEFSDGKFHEMPLEILQNERFEKDFKDIYRYYKQAVFSKFAIIGPHLYMVFQIGKSTRDVKTFKWHLANDQLTYVDNRSDHEYKLPAQHDFEWLRATRDQHQSGLHPHVSIDDRVFVETVGGDLTIKVEDNTDSGEGIYSEAVDDPDQTLDDAEISYALVGNLICLKIRPYQEDNFRYIIYNDKIQQARRIDAIENACVLLPDDHGLIFSSGYYLQDGQHKTFEHNLAGMQFERRITAPNGEDYLYVFYNRESGVYILLRYNLIEQQVDTPIICHGVTFFDAGEMVCFRGQDEPQKHHAIQIWQTPYVSEDHVPESNTDTFLYKIGNRDIVRGMSECHEILTLIGKEDTYAGLYVDLVKKSGDVIDSYFWLDNEEAANLKEPLTEIRSTAESAIEEFEKVVRVKQNTAAESKRVGDESKRIVKDINHARFDKIDDFVRCLADLRAVRGDVISLRELRYIDHDFVDDLEKEISEHTDRLANRCVEFLLHPDSLESYVQRVQEQTSQIDGLTKVSEARELEDEIASSASELEMLIEIVSNLKIDDATHRTTIIDNISAIFSNVNQARASLKARAKELMSVEGIAEFNSQMKLLNQSVVNYLDICDTPEKCEDFLTKVMIQIEELEGRFAEFDEFVIQLTEKREEIYNAFETRKLSLVEARNKRANSLMSAAERILKGIKSRVESLESINEINGYFASDLMIDKVRDIVEQLGQLDDSVKVDDIQSRLKTIREDAVRQLKDRQELFVDGANIIQFGKHKFSVNVQALDLTTVLQNDQMCLHLTGTKFFETIEDERLLATRDVWDQEVISENRSVYRAEYLAYLMQRDLSEKGDRSLLDVAADELQQAVQRYMGPRYSEAYVKGVHDVDAARILGQLLKMESTIGLLRYHTRARSLARVCWNHFGNPQRKELLTGKVRGFGTLSTVFPNATAASEYKRELLEILGEFVDGMGMFDAEFVEEAGEYLLRQLMSERGFCVSQNAAQIYDDFHTYLTGQDKVGHLEQSLAAVKHDVASRYYVLRDWSRAYLQQRVDSGADPDDLDFADEVAAVLLDESFDRQDVISGSVIATIDGMVGNHSVIEDHKYHLNYNQFAQKLEQFERDIVPRYRSYIDLKKEIVDAARDEMKLEEFRPRVLTSFVRNRLIDEVYLPLVGDNLAKQLGVVGEDKRTDLMGLLLLVSPPGYGKTTLMEYIANRLGIIFMKINGPAIGHQVTSLDPNEAPNAGAREEVEKLNLSLEMGDNVMIYLDDIQHCNPEFLQKFISLCDATRKIEGVYKGRTRTYDLRGRKVAVVMAGNPYTESGEKFQIPDMLSNRADIYNLGEIIGDTADSFEMSYLENALTSNPVLSKLSSRSQKDVHAIIRMAELDQREGIELEGNYSMEEVNELVSVMKKLTVIRDVVLKVNRQYIESAAQADEYRVEPPFKLQGSYRNMNRIAEKVVPIMNDDELQTLILSNYENDSQTLTSDNEANMLKFKELMGILTPLEEERWESIKRAFVQNVKMRGVDPGDKIGQVLVQLSSFSDGLDSIRGSVNQAAQSLVAHGQDRATQEPQWLESLVNSVEEIRTGLSTIGGSIKSAAQDIATSPGPPAGGQHDGLASDAMIKLAEEIRALTTASIPVDASASVQRVSVMHKVPRSILEVMRSQFDLMSSWLQPLHNATVGNSAEIRDLKESLETCLTSYSALLEELEDARTKQD